MKKPKLKSATEVAQRKAEKLVKDFEAHDMMYRVLTMYERERLEARVKSLVLDVMRMKRNEIQKN